jgi:hypothetical protein
MNRYKYALGKIDSPKMDPELEIRLRNGAAAWMLENSPTLTTEQLKFLEIKASKAHMVALRIFPEPASDDCIKTAADFMHLDEEKLDKIIGFIRSGK